MKNLILESSIFKVLKFILKRMWGVTMEKIIAKVIEKVISQMSDNFRKQIIESIKDLEVAAEATQNPWDDILVLILKVAVGIE